MGKYFESDVRVSAGQRVKHAGKPARIVFVVEENLYFGGYRSEHWAHLEKGIGIEEGDGTLYVYEELESEEDIKLIDNE
jgi:hypothetical protein